MLRWQGQGSRGRVEAGSAEMLCRDHLCLGGPGQRDCACQSLLMGTPISAPSIQV